MAALAAEGSAKSEAEGWAKSAVEAEAWLARSQKAQSELLKQRTLSTRGSSDASSTDVISLDRSPSISRGRQDQSSLTKNEEYRQQFNLPPEEVLVKDLNCALKEEFMLQGHMYLFTHYICFHANVFGFVTQKIISVDEISYVTRVNVVFPPAIKILAAGKKYIFASFVSREEAFKLINDIWELRRNETKLITDQQDVKPVVKSQEIKTMAVEKTVSSSQFGDGHDLLERNKDSSAIDEVSRKIGMPSTLENVNDDVTTDCSSSGKSLVSTEENSDAPGGPKSFNKVAESDILAADELLKEKNNVPLESPESKFLQMHDVITRKKSGYGYCQSNYAKAKATNKSKLLRQ